MTEQEYRTPDPWVGVLLGSLIVFTAALFLAGAASAEPIPTNSTNLIWLYQWDDGAGGSFTVENDDVSGGTRNLTCSNAPAEVTHAFNGTDSPGIKFTDTNDRCEGASEAAGIVDDVASVAWWMNVTSCPNDVGQDWVLHAFSKTSTAEWWGINLDPVTCDMYYTAKASDGVRRDYDSTIRPGNVWTHYVITWDTSGFIDFYANGSLIHSTAWNGLEWTYESTAMNLFWGTNQAYEAASYFVGSIDDIGYWDREINSTEIVEFATLINATGGSIPLVPIPTISESSTTNVSLGIFDINPIALIGSMLPLLMMWQVWKNAVK